MTLQEILSYTAAVAAETPLGFIVEGERLTRGYNLTEFKLVRVQSIDCGARVSETTEASMQLLHTGQGAGLTAAGLGRIVERSAPALPGLERAHLVVEYAPGGSAKRIYRIARLSTEGEAIVLHLAPVSTECKPSAEARARGTACCTA
ncbi:MAG: DUF6428 family protein [Pseudomonadota bacterium]